jgi:peptide chain release factor subunit 1
VSSAAAAAVARRLIERRAGHPVISLYLDLDPERFATAPARASQIRSLVDQAARAVDAAENVTHDERLALRSDVQRLEEFLSSREAPFQGARGLGRSARDPRTCSRSCS